ncbi:MAG: MFS transporter [Deltaproteobacteria bacterium]|nr:MFS transporter [Deltaproteobacteria bacterium]
MFGSDLMFLRIQEMLEGAKVSARTIVMFNAMRYRNYRLYWLGQLSSVLAQGMELVAQGWLILQLTDSPFMLGLTGLAHAIPTIVLTLVGGVIADRIDRRRIMILAQGTTACVFFGLATLIVTGLVQVWHIMLFAFLSGSLKAFDRPSRYALLPHMVSTEELASAVAMGSAIWQLSRLIGPGIAGTLIYVFGVGTTFYVCCLGSLTAVVFWLMIRMERLPSSNTNRGLLHHMADGLNFIKSNEIFYTLIGMTFFNSIFGLSYVILMPVFARDILQVGSQGFGFLQTTTGAGSLLGVLIVASLARSSRKGWQVIMGAVIFGISLIGFAFSPWYLLSLGLVFFIGLANQVYMTTIISILQLKVPDQLRGRVMSIFGLTWDLTPVGGTIAGTIAEFAGAPVAVAISCFMVMAMASMVAVYLPRVRQME